MAGAMSLRRTCVRKHLPATTGQRDVEGFGRCDLSMLSIPLPRSGIGEHVRGFSLHLARVRSLTLTIGLPVEEVETR